MKPTVSVVPVTCLILAMFFAPHAWPIRMAEPEASPMTKLIRKIMMGKKVEMAASARVPIIWPMNTLLMVPDRLCRILLSISGRRKTRKRCHSGRERSFILVPYP